MTVTHWNPVTGLETIEVERLNNMFDRIFTAATPAALWTPAVDIYETSAKDVVVKAELPDMKREDIKVTFENDVLTIEGERPMAADVPADQFHRLERSFGAFRRSFTLPSSIDAARVAAGYKDGVLTVTLPQREESRARQIQVNG